MATARGNCHERHPQSKGCVYARARVRVCVCACHTHATEGGGSGVQEELFGIGDAEPES